MSDADKDIFNFEASMVMPILTEHVVASYVASKADDFKDYMQRLDLTQHIQSAAFGWALSRHLSLGQTSAVFETVSKTNDDFCKAHLKKLADAALIQSRDERHRLGKLQSKTGSGEQIAT